MYCLYLDTCIVNDTFPLIQNQGEGEIGQNDLKVPMSRWAAEYVALYHLLDLDDQWELEFGTSQITMQEIDGFIPDNMYTREKKTFLKDMFEELYKQFAKKCRIESHPIALSLAQRVVSILGPVNDALHIWQAIQAGYDFFVTTDFRTILNHGSQLEKLMVRTEYHAKLWPKGEWEPVVEILGIKVRSPLQFLEGTFMPLPTLIRTMYGPWTDPDQLGREVGQALLQVVGRSRAI
jgi:hypothetical protein